MSTKDNQPKENELIGERGRVQGELSDGSVMDSLEIDIDELTKNIEERIDELFRPDAEISFEIKTESPEERVISEVIGSDAVERRPPTEQPLTTSDMLESVEEPTLMELLEKATISYLSLDWEFSQENLTRMRESLKAIESKITPVGETHALFKILERLLNWFAVHDRTVSSVSLALFRETLQFLTKLVQRDQKIGEKDRDITEQFIKRFNILKKQYAIQEPDVEIEFIPAPEVKIETVSVKQTKISPVVTKEPPVPVTKRVPEAVVTDRPAVQKPQAATEISSLEDLKREIENLRVKLDNANYRLIKVVQLLSSRPKLKPVGERLEKIVELYRSCANQTKGLETFLLTSSDSFIQSLLRDYDLVKPAPLFVEQPPSEKVEPQVERIKPREPEKREESLPEAVAGETGIKEVNLFLCQGKYFAIPSDQIVKYDQISSAKAIALTSRGVGTLKDVKPFFKSVKHGVKGVWRDKSDKELKSMVFRYVDLRRKFNLPGYKSEYGGVVVFASNFKRNIMFIVDSIIGEGPFPVREIKSVKEPGIVAIANLDQYKNVDVINVNDIG